jgi:hypothetical protein
MFDGDWATDKNDQKSVSSYITTIGVTSLVTWQSKKQQTVALSSCESETMALTVCAQDILFVTNLLQELVGDELLKPSFIYGDNVASLFLTQNNSVSQRTKHINIRHRFVYDLVEDKQFELRHVKTDDNTSDISSKNKKIKIHKKLADRLYNGLPIAEVKQGSSIKWKSDSTPLKEHVEYSSAITTIVINGSLSSLDANPSNPPRNPVDDPMTVTRAMTPAEQLACGLATNTVTVDGSNTHEMASWGCKDRTLVTTATISSDREENTAGSTKETLVVDHNKREEAGISERESISVNCSSELIRGIN